MKESPLRPYKKLPGSTAAFLNSSPTNDAGAAEFFAVGLTGAPEQVQQCRQHLLPKRCQEHPQVHSRNVSRHCQIISGSGAGGSHRCMGPSPRYEAHPCCFLPPQPPPHPTHLLDNNTLLNAPPSRSLHPPALQLLTVASITCLT